MVSGDLHVRIAPCLLEEVIGLGDQQAVADRVEAVRRLLETIVRLDDRSDLGDQLLGWRWHEQESDGAMVNLQAPRYFERLPATKTASGGEQDLLLQCDVLEQAGAEGAKASASTTPGFMTARSSRRSSLA